MKKLFNLGIVIFITVMILIMNSCGEEKPQPKKKVDEDMSHLFPDDKMGWQATGNFKKYDWDGIFTYIDGAGEVFRMYDYRQVWVQKYIKPEMPEITVEIFDMGKPEDAFGIFMHSKEGTEFGLGQGSEFRGSILSFWKGKYFVSLTPSKGTTEVEKAMIAMALDISGRIEKKGEIPEIVYLLPEQNRIDNTLRFFHLHTSLNYHYYLSPENILNLIEKTDVAMAEYLPGAVFLACIKYPTQEDAKIARASFQENYLKRTGDENIVEIDNGVWTGIAGVDDYLIIVFDAIEAAQVADLLFVVESNIRSRLKGEKNGDEI
jgi:hypothetical protein